MRQDNPAKRKLVKALAKTREKHKAQLARVEKTRAKLEKRKRKLQALEVRIANLERRTADPQKKKLGQAVANDANLRRARLIVNPASGKEDVNHSKRLVEIIGNLREHGILAGIGLKTSGQAARQLAKEAVENGEDLVIVAGGDGTIEEVASQLVNTQTTLGIVPMGTMNNVARSLGIPLRIDEACALIGMGVARKIDVGRVVANEKPDIEYFLESAGIGLSAIVIPTGHAIEKQRWRTLPAALQKLFDSKPEPIQVELDDGRVIRANSQMVTISNAPLTGKNLLIAPDAKMDDGQLDIAIYEGMSKTDLVRYFAGAGNGARPPDPRVSFYRASHVRIRAAQELEASSDKDVIGAKRNFEIELVPHTLAVIVGKGMGLSLPVEAATTVPPTETQADNGNQYAVQFTEMENANNQ